jgi:PPOX class probable F420-dependent enzyme
MTYPSMTMTQQQIDAFLSKVRNGVLATNRPEGAPQLSTVWYVYDQGLIYIGFDASSAKQRNLMRDQRVSFCVGGEHPDSRTVTIYGTAEFVDKNDPRFNVASRQINQRYSQTDKHDQDLPDVVENNAERMIVAIRPEKILAKDYN